MFCPDCDKENNDRVSFCQSCGRRIGGLSLYASIEAPRWAGFWRRFAASILDGIVLTVSGLILGVVVGIAFWYSDLSGYAVLFYGFLLEWIYYAAMESSARQATIGKMALGIIVTDSHGKRLSFGRATARHFSKVASALTFGIGFLLVGFTRKKQALHDMITGCLVVEKEPEGRYSTYPGRPMAPSWAFAGTGCPVWRPVMRFGVVPTRYTGASGFKCVYCGPDEIGWRGTLFWPWYLLRDDPGCAVASRPRP